MRAAAPICFSKGKAAELHVAFCLILLCLGIAITGLLHLLRSWAWWVPLLPGFVLGLAVMAAAKKTQRLHPGLNVGRRPRKDERWQRREKTGNCFPVFSH